MTNQGPVSLEPDQQLAIAPGSYDAVTIKSRATLMLQAGNYFFTSFSVEPQGKVQTSGALTLEVRDSMTFRGSVATPTNTLAPSALRYRGTNTLFLEGGWYGSVLAPNALVVIGGAPGATLRGQLFAQKIELRPDVVVRAESPATGGVLQVLPPL